MLDINITHLGHSLDVLKKMDDESVSMCVTSPPYWGLRDYGEKNQLGLEKTPEEYVANMVEIFDEVKRVLKAEGTLWLNLGDSYASSSKNRSKAQASRSSTLHGGLRTQEQILDQPNKITGDLKPKDLVGIPWMVAFALRSAGWYLRQDIIWHKPGPMPESVTDRCTKAHEYIFLLSKNKKYYYDHKAIMQPAKNPEDDIRRMNDQKNTYKSIPDDKRNGLRPRKSGNKKRKPGSERGCPEDSGSNVCSSVPWEGTMANKRSVWTVNTKPFAAAHFATFPPDLIVPCIKAGCPEDGIVLNPFHGAGTTGMVARKLNRNFIGIELNPEYITISEKRMRKELGLFN